MTLLVPFALKEITTNASSTAIAADSLQNAQQVELQAATADLVVKFGDSTVSASATKTSNQYPAFTVVLKAGEPKIVYTVRTGQTHYSVVSKDGATAGVLSIGFSSGEV